MKPHGTLQSILEALPSFGERNAVGLRKDFGVRWWSYHQLYRNSIYAASLLKQQDLRPGERIVLYAQNCPEWLACFFGAVWLGVVVVPVDATASSLEAERIAQEVNARLVVLIPGQPSDGIEHRLLRLISLDETSTFALDPLALRHSSQPKDTAVILYTSGTEGQAQGVVLTHANIMCQIPRFLPWRHLLRIVPTRILALSPLSHIQGLMLAGCVPLSIGLSILYTHSIEPYHLERTIRSSGVRILATVPRVLQLLQDSIQRDHTQASASRLRRRILGRKFRIIFVGGATLPIAREEFWRKSGCLLVQGYGSTETTAFVTINRAFAGRKGSIGRPVHPDSLSISDEGELLVKGPHLSQGYQDSAFPLTKDGFLPTGDIVRQEKDGRLYFLGRRSNRIVTAEGHNIHPESIETELREDARVQDAIVFARTFNGMEELHAVLLLMQPSDEMAAEVIHATNARLQSWQRLRGWSIWKIEDFPRGALGKPLRSALLAAIDSPQKPLLSVAAVSLPQIMMESDSRRRMQGLLRYFQPLLEKVEPDVLRKQLRELGLDSIEEAELITLLESPVIREQSTSLARLGDAFPRSSAPIKAATWQRSRTAAAVRGITRSLLRIALLKPCLQVDRTGVHHLSGVKGPFVFAVHRNDRQHASEYLAVWLALPDSLRKRLLFLIGDQPFFTTHFYQDPRDSWSFRLAVRFIFHLGLPLLVPFEVLESGTTRGLEEASWWIERGYHPLVTWAPSTARIAVETQATVIPIRLIVARKSWRNRIRVQLEAPITIPPFADAKVTYLQVESLFRMPLEGASFA